MQLTQHYILVCTWSSNSIVKEQILTVSTDRSHSVVPSAVEGKNTTSGFHLACITKGDEMTMWFTPWPQRLVIKPHEMCRIRSWHWVPGQSCSLIISDYNPDVHSWIWSEMAQVSSHDLRAEHQSRDNGWKRYGLNQSSFKGGLLRCMHTAFFIGLGLGLGPGKSNVWTLSWGCFATHIFDFFWPKLLLVFRKLWTSETFGLFCHIRFWYQRWNSVVISAWVSKKIPAVTILYDEFWSWLQRVHAYLFYY